MKKIIILVLLISSISTVHAQKAWEIGIGGTIYQFKRISFVNTKSTDKGNQVDLKVRNIAYTGNFIIAKEISNIFVLDGKIGIGTLENKFLFHGQVGLQMRTGYWLNYKHIDPYARIGIGYMHKAYNIDYLGDNYYLQNVGNKDGKDLTNLIPIALGVGVNMWINDIFGIGLQGDYMIVPKKNVANSLMGSINLLFRIRGKSKKPEPIITYVDKYVDKIVEKVVEKEVIKEVEKVIEVEKKTPQVLLSQIMFGFDSDEIDEEYYPIIEEAAQLMKDSNWLITGFTDSRGSIDYNKRLSLRRAEAICHALQDNGVVAVKAVGAGEKIANANYSHHDEVRRHDRKIYVEEIKNEKYWEIF